MEFLDPAKVLSQLQLRSDMQVAEFGCGSGGFSLPLAKKIKDGLVYSFDVQEAPLTVLKSRANFEKVTNIKVEKRDLERPRGSGLSDSTLDLVLIPNVLFQVEDKNAIISEAKRVLRNEGTLVIIDWASVVAYGPKEGLVSPEDVKKMAKDLKLKLEKEFPAGEYHYVLVFRKSAEFSY